MKTAKTILKKPTKGNSKTKAEKLDDATSEKIASVTDTKVGGKVNGTWTTNTSTV